MSYRAKLFALVLATAVLSELVLGGLNYFQFKRTLRDELASNLRSISLTTAALIGDKVSLGFVVETERQVEAHLGEHLQKLPNADARSRAVVLQMQSDEARHGEMARRSGGIDLPQPIRTLMKFASAVMKSVAYRI